jgi:hypothetical protein
LFLFILSSKFREKGLPTRNSVKQNLSCEAVFPKLVRKERVSWCGYSVRSKFETVLKIEWNGGNFVNFELDMV